MQPPEIIIDVSRRTTVTAILAPRLVGVQMQHTTIALQVISDGPNHH